MSHHVDCPGCFQTISVASQYLGQLVSCPHCGGTLKVKNPQETIQPDPFGLPSTPGYTPAPLYRHQTIRKKRGIPAWAIALIAVASTFTVVGVVLAAVWFSSTSRLDTTEVAFTDSGTDSGNQFLSSGSNSESVVRGSGKAPREFAYLPDNAQFLFYCDVAAITQSSLFKRLSDRFLATLPSAFQLESMSFQQEFFSNSKVAFGLWLPDSATNPKFEDSRFSGVFTFAKPTRSLSDALPSELRNQLKRETHHGHEVFIVSNGGQSVAFAEISKTMLLFGDLQTVKKQLESDDESYRMPLVLKDALNQANFNRSFVALFSLTKSMRSQFFNSVGKENEEAIPHSILAHADIDSDIRVDVSMLCRSRDGATDLREIVQLGVDDMARDTNSLFARTTVNSVRVSATGKTVNIATVIPGQSLLEMTEPPSRMRNPSNVTSRQMPNAPSGMTPNRGGFDPFDNRNRFDRNRSGSQSNRVPQPSSPRSSQPQPRTKFGNMRPPSLNSPSSPRTQSPRTQPRPSFPGGRNR